MYNIIIVDNYLNDLDLLKNHLEANNKYNTLVTNDFKVVCNLGNACEISIIVINFGKYTIESYRACKSDELDFILKSIPVIITTHNFSECQPLVTSLKNEKIDYLQKPLIINELETRIRLMLNLFDLNREIKEKIEILKLQDDLIEQEKKKLNEILEFKKQEIISKTLQLAHFNDFLNDISEQIRDINKTTRNKNLSNKLKNLNTTITSTLKGRYWDEFEVIFEESQLLFYTKLKEKHPTLSQNDRKICALLRMNLTSKEISKLTFQSINTIDVARSRLRKKFNLAKDENLLTYLMSI